MWETEQKQQTLQWRWMHSRKQVSRPRGSVGRAVVDRIPAGPRVRLNVAWLESQSGPPKGNGRGQKKRFQRRNNWQTIMTLRRNWRQGLKEQKRPKNLSYRKLWNVGGTHRLCEVWTHGDWRVCQKSDPKHGTTSTYAGTRKRQSGGLECEKQGRNSRRYNGDGCTAGNRWAVLVAQS